LEKIRDESRNPRVAIQAPTPEEENLKKQVVKLGRARLRLS
jgi:hypothetical protein